MATTESVSASAGPRYAPEDPTLPKPWLGLIDGSSGTDCLYYWNPETNVTQYEKPAALPPPLPPGPPPSTPKLAQIPTAHSVKPNGLLAPVVQSQGQDVGQMPQPNGHGLQQQSAAQFSNKQDSQYGQPVQQSMQMRPQLMQYPVQQMSQQPGQGMQQQVIQQSSYQVGLHQNTQMVQGPNVYQQQQYMAFQHGMVLQGQQNSQQMQIGAKGFQYLNQPDHKVALPNREESDYHQGKQTPFSPSQFQQTGGASSQTISSGKNTVIAPQAGALASNPNQYHSSAVNAQKPGQFQQTETDFVHQQHAPQFLNQTRPPMMHNQQPNASHVGFKPVYEKNMHGGSGNNYHYNAKVEGSVMSPPQSQPAANSMEPRMGAVPLQNSPTSFAGGFNPSGYPIHNMYGHAVGGPSPNTAPARPPPTGMREIPNASAAEVYRLEHEVTATGDNVPAPFMTFEASGFPPEILRDIQAAGFLSPTPIQAQTWPIALQGKDIVAIAKTGSGKTLGYLIPAFILLRQLRNNPQNGPTVVVLAPTRELATQIQDEVIKFGRSSRVSCTCLYGGAPKGPQLRELDRGADIVVATPGRLNDILEMKKIDFRQVSLLVLDEADRMLDMGFEPQIRKIVNEIPPRRQTLMYTATWPKEVRKIASDLLVNPVQVNIGSVDELAANKSITQYVEVVPPMEKDRRLEQILRAQERGSKVIIFCSTKRLCDQLARGIGRNFGALAIHGNKSQNERDWVLNQFRSGKSPILVATDVAARGLDIKDIRVVINYDFPTGIEDYVHRIGRTGRAGATGVSYTFFSEQDWKYAADLVKVLEGANQLVPPEVREMALRGGPGFGKDRGGMGMGRFDSVGGRWDSGGRGGMRDGGRGGMRDGSFGGRGGIRDGNYGGRGGMRDGGFGGRGGGRDGPFGGRGGGRDGPFGGRGGRGDSFLGHGNRGHAFSGPAGGNIGWGRSERGSFDRQNMDGRGRGRGRGRFDGRRDVMDRSRGRSYSRSPEKVRTWDLSRSRSRSRSWSRSRSRSWSRSRSRSRTPRRNRSYSRSPRRSRSYSRSPRRSYSRSPDQRSRRQSGFDRFEKPGEMNYDKEAMVPKAEASSGEAVPVAETFPGPHGEEAFSKQIAVVDNPEATAVAGPPWPSET